MIQSNQIFKPLYNCKKRYILITGGRGSGKSFEVSTYLTLLTYVKSTRILFTRYTMVSAHLSIIPEFQEKVDLLEVAKDFKVNTTDITNLQTESDILFRGIKASSGIQTANLKSIAGLSTWANDESEELVDENVFDTIDLSIRAKDKQNTIILIMNPSNKDHWIYKRWIANHSKIAMIDGYPVEISTHPEVLHIHTTYLDNLKNLNEQYIQQQREKKITAPKWFGLKIIGQWSDVAEGAIFSNENLQFYKEDSLLKWETSIAYIDVADSGTDYLCMVVGRNVGSTVYIDDVIFSDKNSEITIPYCLEALIRNNVEYCRVESNNQGATYGVMLRQGLERENSSTQILLINNSANKHTRILMEAPTIYSFFRFKVESERSAMYQNFMNQLYRYTKDGTADHDDAPDATSGLSLFIRGFLSHLY